MTEPVVTWAEFEKHIYSYDCWIMVEEKVYNVTDFMVEHPGGDDILVKYIHINSGTAERTPPPHSTAFPTQNTPSVSETPDLSAEFRVLTHLLDISIRSRTRRNR
jgi:hypothetical protein